MPCSATLSCQSALSRDRVWAVPATRSPHTQKAVSADRAGTMTSRSLEPALASGPT